MFFFIEINCSEMFQNSKVTIRKFVIIWWPKIEKLAMDIRPSYSRSFSIVVHQIITKVTDFLTVTIVFLNSLT